MASTTVITAENLDSISCSSLHTIAKYAIEDGSTVTLYRGKWRTTQVVETLVVEDGRAGQWAGGDAYWGDWDDASQTLVLDSGHRMTLDGEEVSEGAVA